jgi:outer membrane lipoprotein-sorting protein
MVHFGMPLRQSVPGQIYLKFVLMRIRQALAVGLVSLAPALTGCLTHIRTVAKTHPAEIVMSESLDQLLTQVETRFNAIQSINATVEIVGSDGGARQGQIKEYPSFSGYIFLRKPEDLRVLMRIPILGSQALDMVSDGKTWKLWIPRKNLAMTGTGDVADPSQNGLESLRPKVIFDSMLVRGLSPDQIVVLTQDSRVLPDPKDKKQLIEEPDYELSILEPPRGKTAHALRVIHVGRSTLLPYQQDIYDQNGHIVTQAFYDNYQTFGDIQFPMKIDIKRPQDQYGLSITITKLTVNQKLDDDQFDLKFPEGVPVKIMK